MKRLLRLLLLIGPLGAMAGAGNSQATPSHNLSGRWSGSFDVVQPDGSVQPDSALFLLKQDGRILTGTAGQSETHQSPIANGEVAGSHAHFDVVVNPQLTVHVDLAIDIDHLHGAATGMPAPPGAKVVVDMKRWPEGTPAPPATHASDTLFATVNALDTKLFDAYNSCDLATLNSMVDDNLEFYHDKTGLTVGKQPFLDAIKSNICGKTQRTLVPGSLEVYPLKDYGAVEIGVHRFHHPGHPEEGVGEAKFVTLWHYKDGAWKISRAISFDHENVKP
jgi:Domain of unknown function (DUF4440)